MVKVLEDMNYFLNKVNKENNLIKKYRYLNLAIMMLKSKIIYNNIRGE